MTAWSQNAAQEVELADEDVDLLVRLAKVPYIETGRYAVRIDSKVAKGNSGSGDQHVDDHLPNNGRIGELERD